MTDPITRLARVRTLPIRMVGGALLALAIFIVFSAPASAQTVCGDHVEFLDEAATRHAEDPKAIGIAADGSVFELLASEAGTWTIIVTRPTGQSCVVATGKAWETLGQPVPGRPVPGRPA